MSIKNNQDEDIRKSLKGLFTDAEIDDILKSEGEEDEGSKEEESEEEKEAKEKEAADEAEKSQNAKQDLEKSINAKIDELKILKSEFNKLSPIQKSEPVNDELMKSFNAKTEGLEKSFGELKEEFTSSLSEITKSLGELQQTISTIGENSKGMKGHQFSNFIQKGGEQTEDGFTMLNVRDKESISKSLMDIMEKSQGDEKEALSNAIMNLECTGVGSLIQNRTAMSVLQKNKIKLGQ